MRPDRHGTVRLREATRIGDRTLKAGYYELQYRLAGADRFLHIMQIRKDYGYARSAWESRRYIGEVRCRVEPLEQRAPETVVSLVSENGARRIVWIELTGQSDRCLPEASPR